jgi:tetratricopeptide (TPR) repeat protein
MCIFYPGKTHILSKEAHNLLNKAGTAIINKDPGQVLLYANKAIELEPEAAYPYYIKAFAYSMLKDYSNYEKNIQRTISLFPDFKDAHVNYIKFLLGERRFEEAKEHLIKVNQLDPSDKNIIINLKAAQDSINARAKK